MRIHESTALAAIIAAIAVVHTVALGAGDRPPVDAPFASEILAFEAADAEKPPEPDGVLFVGSSSIRLWTTLGKDFPDLPVINRGFGGSQIADSTRYADRIVLPYKPKTIVLYAGDNDIAAGRSPEQVLADFKAFVAKVGSALPKTRVLFIAIKPSIARWKLVDKIREANRLVEEFTQGDEKLAFIDIFTPMLGEDGMPRGDLLGPDGLHLNEKGYALWREVVAAKLKQQVANP